MTTKNYSDQGGDKWVVGGTLEIKDDGIIILDGMPLTRATVQEESKATTIADLKADFNELLAKLQAAGLMEKAHE